MAEEQETSEYAIAVCSTAVHAGLKKLKPHSYFSFLCWFPTPANNKSIKTIKIKGRGCGETHTPRPVGEMWLYSNRPGLEKWKKDGSRGTVFNFLLALHVGIIIKPTFLNSSIRRDSLDASPTPIQQNCSCFSLKFRETTHAKAVELDDKE